MDNPWLRFGVFFLLNSLFFLLVPSISTPLNPTSCFDYDKFMVMGQGWLNGLIPGKDLFDNKGPVTYFFQMAALATGTGKWGIWILEVLWGTWTCGLLYRIGNAMKCRRAINLAAIMIFFMLSVYYIDGGNRVEEWSLPFLCLPLYYCIASQSPQKIPVNHIFIIGLCFGIIVLIRLNNTAIILGLGIAQAIAMGCLKHFRQLMTQASWFVAGASVVIIPFAIYFWAFDALHDEIFCAYTYNFFYVGNWHDEYSLLQNSICLIPVVIAITLSMTSLNHRALYITCAGIVTILTLIPFGSYPHYFIISLPFAPIAIQLCANKSWLWILTVVALIFLPLINIPVQAATFRIERHFKIKYCRHYDYNYSYLLDSIMNQIPADELDSVYLGAEINDVGALLRFGKSPIGKYVCEQIDMAKVHPTVKDDIIRQFTSAQPKWVLTHWHRFDNHPVLMPFTSRYELIDSVGQSDSWIQFYYLYRRR